MLWSQRLNAMPRKTLAVATVIAALGGLAGVIGGLTMGSVPLVIGSCAVTFSAGLIPAVADWCQATAAVEASRRANHEQAAIATPERRVEPPMSSREETIAAIKAYYARLEGLPDSGSGRFQELVSVEHQPGWDRVH